MTSRTFHRLFVAALAALVLFTTPAFAAGVADATLSADRLSVRANVAADGGELTLAGPGGVVLRSAIAGGSTFDIPLYDDRGALADGVYVWELRTSPQMSDSLRADLAEVRDEALLQQLQEAGVAPTGISQYGVFTLKNGVPVDASLVEASDFATGESTGALVDPLTGTLFEAAQVIATDLIVQGSACVGFDCTSTESFGSDTLRLKENNLRIHFDDTSASASFPGNDWRIIANDSTNGGNNYLAIEDSTAGTQPFRVDAGAGNNALIVDSDGQVGIGTAAPAVNLHVVEGNTPTLRLQQDGSSGFTPYTWDLAGNETNFFLRDVNSSSDLPFRVFPGTGDDSLVLRNGRVGMNVENPSQSLHVRETDGTTQLFLDEADTTAGNIVMLRVENDGGNVQTEFAPDGGATTVWRQNFRNASFDIDSQEDAVDEFSLTTGGDLTVSGEMNATAFNVTSDRDAKRSFAPVSGQDVLSKIAAIPVTTWVYKTDEQGARHIGPMAQDFHAAFGLGADERRINPQDTASVALVGVQALNHRLSEKEAQVEALVAANAALIERLEALEAKLSE